MSKELEAFERIIETYGNTNSLEGTYDNFLTIKKALQRLETIDNTEPSEALESLHTIAFNTQFIAGMNFGNELRTIKQALLKAQEQKKVLNIIKEKDVDIYILKSCKTVNEYNSKIVHIIGETRELTEEEFLFLKEMLKNV